MLELLTRFIVIFAGLHALCSEPSTSGESTGEYSISGTKASKAAAAIVCLVRNSRHYVGDLLCIQSGGAVVKSIAIENRDYISYEGLQGLEYWYSLFPRLQMIGRMLT